MGSSKGKRRAAKTKAREKARAREKTKAREKARAREKTRAQQEAGAGSQSGPNPTDPRTTHDEFDQGVGSNSETAQVERLYSLYLAARQQDDAARADQLLERLYHHRPSLVTAEVERDLALVLTSLWDGGWLPGELLRQAQRGAGANGRHLAARAIAADHTRRQRATLHPRWIAHVAALELPTLGSARRWLSGCSQPKSGQASSRQDWIDLVRLGADVTLAWTRLGRMPQLIPPPGSPEATGSDAEPGPESIIDLTGAEDGSMLAKVRHLLAQAESTTFDAEAEAFTAKAQELMARHAIDAAMVWDRQDRSEKPTSARIPIDDPYSEPKSRLLAGVATENQCRAVLDPHHGSAHLVGFAGDLVWVETLFTSLLVQAQQELIRAGAGEQAGSRRRGRGFRASFLSAFAVRIQERLAEINHQVLDDHTDVDPDSDPDSDSDPDHAVDPGSRITGGSALVPVLERRAHLIEEAVEDLFGEGLTSSGFRGGNDPMGWNEGRQAADRADLQKTVTSG